MAEVVPAVRTRVRVVDPEPAVDMGPFGGGILMGVADPVPPLPLAKGAWLEPGADAAAVISAGFGGRYGLDVGDALTVGGIGGEVQLKVVGIVGSGGGGGMPMFSPNLADIYVSFAAAEIVNGFTSRWNVINLVLREGDRAEQFADDWAARTAAVTPPVSFSALRKKEGDPMAGRMLGMIELQAQNATVLAFLAAGFIIFATLSGGMRERLREMASLRAIAMSRKQLVAMIFLEGILLALVGWSVGLVLSRGLLGLGNALAVYLRFFQAGAFADFPLSGSAILVSGACALIGSLAASALLAWQAARLKPIDILGGSPGFRSGRFPWFAVGIGALLVVANPIAVLIANVEPFKSFFAETYTMGFGPPLLGCGAMILGMALVIPGVILLVEAVFGRLLALVLGLDRRFLRQQLTGNLWRTVWTTISISAGLTLFVTALVWGYSMLVPFTPDKSLPRMLISILPAGIPESAVAELAKVDGVIPGECLAMAVEQPRLTGEMLSSPAFASVDESQQHPLLMGVDPRQAFGGGSPVLEFTFIQGDREAAVRKLAEGRFCLVPDHFHTQTGLGIGDRFSLEVPDSPGKSVEYEIAGVVYVPGWNWFTKFADIRRRSGRALAMLFAGYEQVKADFGIDRISYFWMNVAPEVSVQEITMRLDPLADRHANVVVDVPGAGKAMVAHQYIKITERG